METHEVYCSLETAKLLKQAGFDWGVVTNYSTDSKDEEFILKERCNFNWNQSDIQYECYSAPSLSITQKWLREVKGYVLLINYHEYLKTYYYSICYIQNQNRFIDDREDCRDTSYEEALEAGIKKCLELLLK